MPLYNFDNSRTAEQLSQMQALADAGVCLFCPDQGGRDLPVVQRLPLWTVITNRFPYRGTKLHLLLVPDEHVADLVDLSAPAQAAFWTALAWARSEYGLTFYSLAVRNGDPRFTGATIRHLHVHLLTGDVENPDHEPVRVKLSSRPGDL